MCAGAPRESAVEDITSKKLKSGLAESMLAYAQYKAARIFDPMGYQALQVGLQTLGQTTHILHTVHTIEMAADKTQQQLLSVSQQVQQEGALTRQTLTNLFKTQGDQIGQAFNDQLNMLKLIQSEQQSQTAHFDSTAQAILQLIAQSNRDLQHAFAERDRKKLEVALGMVHQFLRNVREDVQEQRGMLRICLSTLL